MEGDINLICALEKLLHLLCAVFRCQDRRENRLADSEPPADKARMLRKNHERSRKIAREGIVLLKNEEHILPLSPGDRIAVIGLYAREPRMTLEGSARVIATGCDIPLDFLLRYGGDNVRWAKGYVEEEHADETELAEEAVRLAEQSDKVVLFMGQTPGVEMEGHDRKRLELPANQERLLERLIEANGNVVVVLSNASAVTMPWIGRVKGVFESFLAGQGFGSAIADLLYGTANPSGKLPVSFTRRLEDTSAYLHFPGDKKTVSYGEGVFVGYRYYDVKNVDVLFPFGYGLSYTDFTYDNICVQSMKDEGGNIVSVSMDITNVGDCAGAEVVQLYIGMFDTVVKRPQKELKRFQKVFLQQGETRKLSFLLKEQDFAYYDVRHGEWYAPEGTYEILLGSSSRDIRLRDTVRIVPEHPHRKPLSGWSKIGELRQTPSGEAYAQKIRSLLTQCVPEDSIFFTRSDLEDDVRFDQLPLRFVNLLTSGILDNDELLQWIDIVNMER